MRLHSTGTTPPGTLKVSAEQLMEIHSRFVKLDHAAEANAWRPLSLRLAAEVDVPQLGNEDVESS